MKKIALIGGTISTLFGFLMAYLASSGITLLGNAADVTSTGGFSIAAGIFAFIVGFFVATIFQVVIGFFVVVGVSIFGKKN
jgi:hypothetical protein